SAIEVGIYLARKTGALLVGLGVVDEPTIRQTEPRLIAAGVPYAEPVLYRERPTRSRAVPVAIQSPVRGGGRCVQGPGRRGHATRADWTAGTAVRPDPHGATDAVPFRDPGRLRRHGPARPQEQPPASDHGPSAAEHQARRSRPYGSCGL